MSQEEYDYLLKLVLIGDSGVGKSNILSRYTKNEFFANSLATVGVEFATRSITINNKVIKAQIWDTAGQERFKAITSAYYRGAAGALMVYDITREDTYESLQRWMDEIREHAETGVSVMILGNKTDLESSRAVKTERAAEYAAQEEVGFLETSAQSGDNIEQAFYTMIKQIYETKLKSEDKTKNTTQATSNKLQVGDKKKKKENNCC